MTTVQARSCDVVVAPGACRSLPGVLGELGARRVLVVASARALRRSPLLAEIGVPEAEVFTDWTPNPTLEQGLHGAEVVARVRPDAVVALGGGSAIDVAKLSRSLPRDTSAALDVLVGRREPMAGRLPLVAVPTTAGSGSEVTRFATVYVKRVKHSLDHPSALPEVALVDPELLVTCPPGVQWSCAFDALCHAVESCWSTRSTPLSRKLALAAIDELLDLLDGGLDAFGTREYARMAAAATTAGRAIDITRTTAAHAFSYHLTSHFDVPHGVACLLNLQWLLVHNLAPAPDSGGEPGSAAVAHRLPPGPATARRLSSWLETAGFGSRLSRHGVGEQDIDGLVTTGLRSSRTSGNPRPISSAEATAALKGLLR